MFIIYQKGTGKWEGWAKKVWHSCEGGGGQKRCLLRTLGPKLLFNIFTKDMNETLAISSLRLYTDDTTQYMADRSPVVLQYT